jgi:hypothetical protein
MKKITLLLVCLLIGVLSFGQTTVTIGTGALSASGVNGTPIYRSSAASTFNFSQSVELLTPADLSAVGITAGSTITKIAYKKLNAFTLLAGRSATMRIYMKNSSTTALGTTTNFATYTTGSTLCYDNAVYSNANLPAVAGWVEFNFGTPFNYTGGSIEVGIDWTINTGTGNPSDGAFAWEYTTVTANQSAGTSNSVAITGNLTTVNTRIYNTQLTYTNTPCIGTPAPGNTVVSTSGCFGSSATLSLQNPTIGSGVTYQWYMNAVAISGATNANYVISNLSTSNTYYCEVTCAGNTTASISLLVGPSILSAPLLEPFAVFLPTCWTNMFGGDLTTGPTASTGSGWVADGFANSGTTGAIRNEIWTTGANDWVISPVINIPTAGYELKFDAAAPQFASVNAPTNAWESDDFIEVLVSTTGLTNWTPVFTYNNTNQPSNTGTPNIIDLDAYAGQNIRIAYRAVEGATNGTADIDFSIDNFQVRLTPTCIEPLNLVFSSVTSSSVNLSWDATTPNPTTGYEYFVSTVNTVPVTAGTATTNTFAIPTGLIPQTTYYVFVRSDCSAGDFSPWTGPITFTTTCAPILVPILEPFDTFLPNICWTEADNGDLGAGPLTFGTGSWLVDGLGNVATTGAIRVTLDAATDNDWVLSPEFTIPAAGYELKFIAAANQTGSVNAPTTAWESDDFVEVLVSTTNLTNWSPIFTYNDTNVPSNLGSINVLDLDAYSGQTVRFAFRAVEGAANGTAAIDFSVDNFEIRLTPLCADQTGLVVSGITGTSANTSWDDMSGSGAVGYQYAVLTSAAPPVSGTATTNTFNIATGLTPQTVHYLHVRTECSGSVYGAWSTITFTTGCAPITILPFLEPFVTFLPNCWSEADNGDLIAGPLTYGSGSWLVDGIGNVGTTEAIRVTLDAATDNDWVLSPEFTIPATGYELKFNAAANQTGSTNAPTTAWESDDFVEVLVSTTNLTNWTPIFTYNDTNVPSNTGSINILDLDAYSGQTVRFAFRAVEGVANGAAAIDFSIDNFEIRLSPTCVQPLNLVSSSITVTTANISWDATTPSPTTGYEYFVSTTNTVPVTAGTATTNTFATLSSLLPDTTYYIFVRSDCSAGDFSPWTGPISFYTGYCLPSSSGNATYVNNFSTTGGSQNISNLATGFTTGGYLNATTQFVEGYATSSFNFNAEIVGGTAGFSIWIDWNNDMIFNNATEKVYNTTAYGNGPFSSSIAIPIGTPIGNYRMRISTDYFSTNPSIPCAVVTRAEFEDYTITVIAQPACVPPVASAMGVTDVAANLNWAAVPSATLGYEYVLDNVATDPLVAGTSTTALTYAASGLTQSTTYYFHIRSVCSVGTYSTWSTISYTTLATPPVNDNCATALVLTPGALFATSPQIATNVGATNSAPTPAPTCGIFAGGDVWYTVTVPASGNITIETQANGASLVNDTQFTVYSGSCGTFTQVGCDDEGGTGSFSLLAITGRPAGEILYVHAYIYNNFQTGTYQISAYDASLSAVSFDKSTFVAYPNPVKDVLNLSYKSVINNVRVVNLLGQEVLNSKTSTNEVQVNMSALSAGAYIVNITVEDTVHTIKVIKE